MPRSKVLQVRISEEEKATIEDTAQGLHIDVSSFVRSRLLTKDGILEERVEELTITLQDYATQLRNLKVIRDEEYTILKKLLALLVIHEVETEDIFTEMEEVRVEKECIGIQSLISKYRAKGSWS